ncbi:MAG: response regulator transcription factor [Treponemataceae bacterium]|nr:response regulator transcription factor [Treponemataceae bacterium]
MQSQLKILFVDDHVGLRDGMTQMLKNKNPDFDFLCASDYEGALETLEENSDIKIVILDLNLDGRSGLELIPEIKKLYPDIAILIYTMFNDVIHVENSFLNGVQGYITKDATIDELATAITTVANGNSYYNKAATELVQSLLVKHWREHDNTNDLSYLFDSYKSLSKKEREVFILLLQDMHVADIAKKLGKSEKTVINQRTEVYSKLEIKDRHDLFEKAKLLGLLV